MQHPIQQQDLRRQNEVQKRPPLYIVGKEGHFGACQQLANQGRAPDPEIYTGPWQNINQGLNGSYREILSAYWQGSLRRLEDDDHDYRAQQLPIARIKKVMKADPEVKMISAEAPILFAKGCEMFITELTMRAWIHAEENKRRTLQRSDIAAALTKSDMFDFLIDIVPRDEAATTQTRRSTGHAAPPAPTSQLPQQQMTLPSQVPSHHHPQEYAPYMPQEQDFRSSQMYAPQGPPDPSAYGHPQAPMFDQSMYAAYPMAPQQMYQMPPQRTQDPASIPDSAHAYRGHDGVVDDDAEGEREYEV